MSLLKSTLKFLLFMVLLLLAASLFLPSGSHVERSIVLPQNPEIPYNLINRLSSWEKWSPWHKMDPSMKIVYTGPPEGKGASYSWTSDHGKVGDGKQTVVSVKPYEYILMDMQFSEGGPARCGFYFHKTDAGTEIKWTIDADAGWNLPSRYLMLLMDFFVGPHFEDGLANLAAEARKVAGDGYTMGFEEMNFTGIKLIGMQYSCQEKEISSSLGLLYGTIMAALPGLGLQMAGAPMAEYQQPASGMFRFMAGIPVNARPSQPLPPGLEYREIPPGKALLCRFNGNYQFTSNAYSRFSDEMKARNIRPAGNPFEVYITDPQSVKNPLEIRTEIIWPVH